MFCVCGVLLCVFLLMKKKKFCCLTSAVVLCCVSSCWHYVPLCEFCVSLCVYRYFPSCKTLTMPSSSESSSSSELAKSSAHTTQYTKPKQITLHHTAQITHSHNRLTVNSITSGLNFVDDFSHFNRTKVSLSRSLSQLLLMCVCFLCLSLVLFDFNEYTMEKNIKWMICFSCECVCV